MPAAGAGSRSSGATITSGVVIVDTADAADAAEALEPACRVFRKAAGRTYPVGPSRPPRPQVATSRSLT